MRNALALAGLLLTMTAGLARSEDTVSDEEARKVGGLFASKARTLADLPIATDVDTEKSRAVRSGEHGALVMPDRRLSAETIADAGKDVKPVGQLWTHKVTPIIDGQTVPDDKLRLVTLEVRDELRTFALFLLGVRKGADGKPELLVYARGDGPLLVLPLVADGNGSAASSDATIELTGKRVDESSGEITLQFLGKHRAVMKLGAQED